MLAARGDFITSVSAGSLFGELLAFQFAEWLEELRIANCELRIIEAGAHDGKLAADILNWLQTHRPKLFSEIEYVIIEPSARRQAWQRRTVENFRAARPLVSRNFQPSRQFKTPRGIIFSQRTARRFSRPPPRLGCGGEKMVRVGRRRRRRKICLDAACRKYLQSSIFRRVCPPALTDRVLPDSYTIETSPAAESWWREAAGHFVAGQTAGD